MARFPVPEYTTLSKDGKFRVCGKCRQTLPVSAFRRWIDNRGAVPHERYESYCKKCRSVYGKERYEEYKNRASYVKHQQESSKTANSYVKARRERDPEYDAKIRERNRLRAQRWRAKQKEKK